MSPDHATPITVTLPANFFATASTEGASALHVLQVGAQNQNATGLPTRSAPLSVPPATFGAENFSTAGTATAGAGAELAGAAELVGATELAAAAGFVVAAGAAEVVAAAVEVAAAAVVVAAPVVGATDAAGVIAGVAFVDVLAVDAPQAVTPNRARQTSGVRIRMAKG
jgi:hypothetical protein